MFCVNSPDFATRFEEMDGLETVKFLYLQPVSCITFGVFRITLGVFRITFGVFQNTLGVLLNKASLFRNKASLRNGRNITLISPRKIGKTGLIRHLFHQTNSAKDDIICI